MSGRVQTRTNSQRNGWRLFWAAVMLAHAPATWSAVSKIGTAEANFASLLILTASNLFFIIEILFAPSLRVLCDRRRLVVFIVVVALLHVGFLQHAPPSWLISLPPEPWLLISVMSAAALAALRPALYQRVIRQLLDALGLVGATQRRRYGFAADEIVSARAAPTFCRTAPRRGPPSRLA